MQLTQLLLAHQSTRPDFIGLAKMRKKPVEVLDKQAGDQLKDNYPTNKNKAPTPQQKVKLCDAEDGKQNQRRV